MTRVLVPLIKGFEELEAITVVNLLRRAGVEVVLAAVEQPGHKVEASQGTEVTAHALLQSEHAEGFDALFIPGGPGVKQLLHSNEMARVVKEFSEADKFIAAICAAPAVLVKHEVVKAGRITYYPESLVGMIIPEDVVLSGNDVECSGKILTGRGPGVAIEFGLALVDMLLGRKARKKVADAIFAV
ncbi:DJ-1 family glyoxalase III [Salinibius halmophilus]|uniref:DJ-1 family glyoxalase III n=1 Tax=Salinibius halmophilus TaxID=1853216 RepID=UPI000E6729D4|nr:DJ-1 family glyoxalase III [Salinibius halmophilus]